MKYIFIILFYLLLLGNVDAWNFKGHNTVVEVVYYNADFSLQQKLNLTLLKEGSTAPDLDFHDTRLHHYPPSYYLAEKWLQAAKNNYSFKEYNKASYAFGVASHYISDSFVAPHYIIKEPGSLHSEFERIKNYNVNVKCYKFDINLNSSLEQASKNKDDWTSWVLNKNEDIPKREFEHAVNLTFPVFLSAFNSICNNFTTEIIKQNFIINNNVIIFLSLILIFYLTFILNKKYKLIKRIGF
ncbi:MAG: zinc dependent phospholipase C family protein [Nanoarchaeota archaeon]